MSAKKNYKDFEWALARLEEVTDKLESGETTLEESIALYTEGMEIAAFCTKVLSEAEKKIAVLKEMNGKFEEVPFEEHEGGEDK